MRFEDRSQVVRSLILSVTLRPQKSENNTNHTLVTSVIVHTFQIASSFSLEDNKTGIILNFYQGD